jgi:hypothetical protein
MEEGFLPGPTNTPETHKDWMTEKFVIRFHNGVTECYGTRESNLLQWSPQTQEATICLAGRPFLLRHIKTISHNHGHGHDQTNQP